MVQFKLKLTCDYGGYEGAATIMDLVEVDRHLKCNGYSAEFNKGLLVVDEDEYYEVCTILNDRNFNYAVVTICTNVGEFAVV